MGTRKNFFEEILDCEYDIISGPGTLYRNTGANSTRTRLVPSGLKCCIYERNIHVNKQTFFAKLISIYSTKITHLAFKITSCFWALINFGNRPHPTQGH